MTDCVYCSERLRERGRLRDGQTRATGHDACEAEYVHRRDTGACVGCGGGDVRVGHTCLACHEKTLPAAFTGYPGE